jgi:phage-related protein
VADFLYGLSTRADLPYIERALDLLSAFGQNLKRPHVAYLRDGIWELRVKTRNGQFRLFHFYFDNQTIVITHGYQKKTDKVADTEIKKALEYRKDFENAGRGQKR